MEQSKCLLQGPRMSFKGLWTYSQLATCLLQARHNTAGLGLGSKPTAAGVYHTTMLHHPCIHVKKPKKREGVRSPFKYIPPDKHCRQLTIKIY